jgi:MOB kinase activator 1
MAMVNAKISNRELFSLDSKSDTYTAGFRKHCQLIFKYLFRIYAHLYHSHFVQFVQLGAETHLNSCCRRFVIFGVEFKLISERELTPLAQLVESFKHRTPTGHRAGVASKVRIVRGGGR